MRRIAIPPIQRGQLDEARDQPGFVVRDDRPMPVCRPRLIEHSAGPPLRDVQPVLYMHHGRAAAGRAQQFPEATSLRIMLSSAWSATRLLQLGVLSLELLEPFGLVQS